jgi:hypothetical protein
MVVVESKSARSLRFTLFVLTRHNRYCTTRGDCDQRTRARSPRKPATRVREVGCKDEAGWRGDVVRRHSMMPCPAIRVARSCVGLHECNPIFVVRIADIARGEQRSATCRLEKANLVSCFAHHRIAHTQRIGTVSLRRIGASSSSNSTEQLLRYNSRVIGKMREKYQIQMLA